MIFLLSLAFAEPQYQKLNAGEVASFDGRLLNDEAIATMISQCEFNVEQCDIQNDLQCNMDKAKMKYDFDILNANYKSLEYKHETLMKLKDEEIEILQKHSNVNRTFWVFVGGFTLGTGASLVTYYTVRNTQ
jgi:hypothetical protein